MADDKLSEKQVRFLAAYAVEVIKGYVNQTRAEAYPMTAEQHGGETYRYFVAHLDNIAKLISGIPSEELLAQLRGVAATPKLTVVPKED